MRQVYFKVKHYSRIFVAICLFAITSFTTILYGQVTIGSGKPPVTGALLDLKEYDLADLDSDNGTTASMGLNLPRVRLADWDKLLPMFDSIKDVNTYRKAGVNYSKANEDARHIGLIVYNLTEDPDKGLTEGLYCWNGRKWVILTGTDPESKFFYMPSFILDTSAPYNSNKTVNLYEAYKKQFTDISTNRRNPTSKQNIPIYGSKQLDYYITAFDDSVLNIQGVTDEGILTYQSKAAATGITYVNVVFVIK